MRNLLKLITILFIPFLMTACNNEQHAKRIGIILPIEHQALNEIIAGFKDTLTKSYHGKLEFKVANAQGDINIERAIITQMRDANYDLLVPIATSTTQMTMTTVKQQPIVALAAEISAHDRSHNTAIINDEIDKNQILHFILQVNPKIKKFTLVHSTADKIFTEVEQIKKAAATANIEVQELLAQNLTDLYSVTQAIATNSQAIFILKDSLIASGVDSLIQAAKLRKIPLITSDDATVKHGAGFALGVHEKQIGEEGGKLAAKILQGTDPSELPIVAMTQPTVFINANMLVNPLLDKQRIIQTAKSLHYPIEVVANNKQEDM